MALLLIHGRSQEGKNPDDLKETWLDALQIGARRAGVQLPAELQAFFPYYGDELVRRVQSAPPVDIDANVRGSASKEATIFSELMAEYDSIAAEKYPEAVNSRQPGIRQDEQLRGSGASIQSVDDEYRGELKVALGRLVDKLIPGATRFIVSKLRDVAAYLGNETTRSAVLKIAKDQLDLCVVASKEKNEPIVVVAHSLGTVVAHDLLAKHNQAPIDLLVTLGSPLGIEHVQNHLLAGAVWPETVKRWINAADSGDIVALIPSLGRSNFFKAAYEKNHDARCDVLNLTDIDNKTDNEHGISGYLDDPGIAREIIAALKRV